MPRHDFSKRTVGVLMRRAGARCSNPGCRRITTGPSIQHNGAIVIGLAAHITAASPCGPRYDSVLSETQRKSPSNGIWLCQNCAKLIDSDTTLYKVDVLRSWKRAAEQYAERQITGETVDIAPDSTLDILFTRSFGKTPTDYQTFGLLIKLVNHSEASLTDYALELWYPPTNEIYAANACVGISGEMPFSKALPLKKTLTYSGEASIIRPNQTRTLVAIVYSEDPHHYFSSVGFNRLSQEKIHAILHRTNIKPLEVVAVISDIEVTNRDKLPPDFILV